MELSVIIPTYNRVSLISYTLDSLDKQHHGPTAIEIIVVDDGSTDDTVAMIRRQYPHVQLLNNKGKGAGAARNTGLEAARGNYIMYLDSDDLAGPNYFSEKIAYLQQHEEVSACYGEYDFFEGDGALSEGEIMFKHKYPVIANAGHEEEHLIHYLGGNYLPPNTIIWRKDLLEQCGGHDSTLSVNQDVELFIRAIFSGLKIAAVADDTKVYIRHHELDVRVGTITNARSKMIQALALRKTIYRQLHEYGRGNGKTYRALAGYLFGQWKILRHIEPVLAAEYLQLAKEVYWPIEIKGNFVYRVLAKVAGPEQAVKMKYLLLKRD